MVVFDAAKGMVQMQNITQWEGAAMQEKLLETIRSILGEDVSLDTSMENTPSWDSIKTLQIVMALDEAGIPIPFERIVEIRSIRDILNVAES